MSLGNRGTLPLSERSKVKNQDFLVYDEVDLIFKDSSSSKECLLGQRRKCLAIGCQLVAPGVILQVVDPRIQVVFVPLGSDDKHFVLGGR